MIDKLTVGLIRSMNSGYSGIESMRDEEIVQWWGDSAQPMADAIRETIREEVVRALRDV